jgi:predicted DNA-binding transcriptional regulator AlpA
MDYFEERMLSLEELRRRMSISKSTLYRLRLKDIPPFNKAIKLGRRVLFPESAFIEWARCPQPNQKILRESCNEHLSE